MTAGASDNNSAQQRQHYGITLAFGAGACLPAAPASFSVPRRVAAGR